MAELVSDCRMSSAMMLVLFSGLVVGIVETVVDV